MCLSFPPSLLLLVAGPIPRKPHADVVLDIPHISTQYSAFSPDVAYSPSRVASDVVHVERQWVERQSADLMVSSLDCPGAGFSASRWIFLLPPEPVILSG